MSDLERVCELKGFLRDLHRICCTPKATKIAKTPVFLGLHREEWIVLTRPTYRRNLLVLEQIFIFLQGREQVLSRFQRQSRALGSSHKSAEFFQQPGFTIELINPEELPFFI